MYDLIPRSAPVCVPMATSTSGGEGGACMHACVFLSTACDSVDLHVASNRLCKICTNNLNDDTLNIACTRAWLLSLLAGALRPGQLVTHVNGIDVRQMDMQAVVPIIKSGTSAIFLVIEGNETADIKVTLNTSVSLGIHLSDPRPTGLAVLEVKAGGGKHRNLDSFLLE